MGTEFQELGCSARAVRMRGMGYPETPVPTPLIVKAYTLNYSRSPRVTPKTIFGGKTAEGH